MMTGRTGLAHAYLRERWKPRARGAPRRYEAAWGLLLPLLLLTLWELASVRGGLSTQMLPSPQAVLRSLLGGCLDGSLPADLWASLQRLAWGFALGTSAGLSMGSVLAMSAAARAYLKPTLELLRQIPVMVLIPFLMLLLGIEDALKIAVVAVSCFFPVALAVEQGHRAVPPGYREVARVYGLSAAQTLLQLTLPSMLVPLTTGLRVGLVRAWVVMVAAEILASNDGLGQLIAMAQQTLSGDLMLAGVIVVAWVAFMLDAVLHAGQTMLQRRFGS